jgi:peptidoglycan/LPS O-acetylase OafA/YrhL
MTNPQISGAQQSIQHSGQEILPLTSLRMVAALLVFLEHFASGVGYGTIGKDFWQTLVIEGHIGVTIFFVLSGFLLTYRYYDVFLDGTLSLFDYVVKRVARIYPLYYVLLIATLIMGGTPFFTKQSLVNWTLTQGFFSGLTFSGIPTAWSLTTEESFYLLLPIVFLSIARFMPGIRSTPRSELARLTKLLAIWTVSLAFIGLVLSDVSKRTGLSVQAGFMSDIHVAIYTTIFFRFFAFAIGILSARLYQRVLVNRWQAGRGKALAYGMAALSALSLLVFMYLMNRAGGIYRDGWFYNYLAAVSSALLILSLTNEHTLVSRIMSLPFFAYWGRISYALYLVQLTPIASSAIKSVNAFLDMSGWAIDYLTVSCVSAALYEVVEKTGAKAVRWASRRLRKPVTAQRIELAQ